MNMQETRMSRAKQNIIWGIVNKAFTLTIPFINRTILVYFLGIEYLGLNSLFVSVLQMLSIAELGVGTALVFSMYKPVGENDIVKVNALLGLYKNLYRYIGFVVAVLGIAVVPLLPHLVKRDLPSGINVYIIYFIFLCDTILGYWLFAYRGSLFNAYQRVDITSNIATALSFTKLVLQVMVLYVSRDYYYYIAVMLVTTIASNVVIYICAKKSFPQCYPEGQLDESDLKPIKKQVGGLMINKICGISRNSLDNIIVAWYIDLGTVAIYNNYYLIMNSLHSLMLVVGSSVTSIVGNSIAMETPEKNHKDMMTLNFVYMYVACNISTCLLCLYQPFMMVWMGKDALLPMSSVVAMVVYFYVLCIGDIRSVYVDASGIWWQQKYRAIAEATCNLVLNILLGKLFGILGIIVATLISLFGINFIYGSSLIYKYYFKNGKEMQYYLYNLYYILVMAVCGFIAWTCNIHLCVDGIGGLIIRGVVCLIVTNAVMVVAYIRFPLIKDVQELVKRMVIRKRR